jgi:hypothetical protein
MSVSTSDDLDVCPANEVRPEVLTWLWPGRLALGKVAIFDGDPDVGKSMVALDLCARLSTGRSMPDGAPLAAPAASIYLSAEDAARDTLLPRLLSLGADVSRVFVLYRKDLRLEQRVSIPSEIRFIDRILGRTAARLLVLDPIVAFLDRSILWASDQSVRRALYPLALLAERHGSAIVLIRHLNKKAGDRSQYRGAGSIGFLAACRCGWLFAPEPQPGAGESRRPEGSPPARRCVMAQLKNNLAEPQPSLAYELRPGEGGLPTLAWLGPCGWSAGQLVARPPRKHHSPGYRAREFLKEFLAGGPRTTAEIWPAALEQDLNKRTVHRARKALGVKSQNLKVDGQRRCYWLLKDQEWPAELRPESDRLDAFLDDLVRRYAPPNPLDDGEPGYAPEIRTGSPPADTAPAAVAPVSLAAPEPKALAPACNAPPAAGGMDAGPAQATATPAAPEPSGPVELMTTPAASSTQEAARSDGLPVAAASGPDSAASADVPAGVPLPNAPAAADAPAPAACAAGPQWPITPEEARNIVRGCRLAGWVPPAEVLAALVTPGKG